MSERDVELVSFATREDWLAQRTTGIGASESAALFGLSRWDSELSLWTKKRGIVGLDAGESERLEIGLAIEPTIAALYQRRTERTLWSPPTPWTIARHPRLPFMTASVDRWIIEAPGRAGRGVLEMKNVDTFMADEWEDGPPLSYTIQFQHQLAVTGFAWGSVAGLIGGNRFRSFDLERDDAFIAELEAKCGDFWGRVQGGHMPSPDGSEASARALKLLHPKDDGTGVHLPDEAVAWWDELARIRKESSANAKREKELKNFLSGAIGAATFGALPDGRLISYKHQDRDGYTVEPTTFRTLKEEKKVKTSDKTIQELIDNSSLGKGAA